MTDPAFQLTDAMVEARACADFRARNPVRQPDAWDKLPVDVQEMWLRGARPRLEAEWPGILTELRRLLDEQAKSAQMGGTAYFLADTRDWLCGTEQV